MFMHLGSKIKGYFVSSACSLGKLAYSAGQTYFGMKRVSNYIFQDTTHPANIIIPCVAVTGGFGVNLITRVPAIFKKFGPNSMPEENERTEQAAPEIGYLGSFFNLIFQASGHLSAFFSALNAHFGTVILSESIAEFLNSDAHDQAWKEGMVQGAALLVAMTALATYYAYDFKMLKQNSIKLAQKIDQKDFSFDRNTAKTLTISALNLIASPILAKFWTAPAIVKIPYANKILKDTGVNCITWTASISSFISGITTLPSIYAYFDQNEMKNISDTALTKAFRYATYITGGIDSLAAGLCAFIGIVDTAQGSLDMNPYGYIISYAIPSGLSASAQNGMFSVWPGYINLIKDLNSPDSPEAQPFLQADNQSENDTMGHSNEEATIVIDENTIIEAFKPKNEITNNGDNTEIFDISEENLEFRGNYFQDHATVGLMFNNPKRNKTFLPGSPCKTEYHVQESSEPIEPARSTVSV